MENTLRDIESLIEDSTNKRQKEITQLREYISTNQDRTDARIAVVEKNLEKLISLYLKELQCKTSKELPQKPPKRK